MTSLTFRKTASTAIVVWECVGVLFQFGFSTCQASPNLHQTSFSWYANETPSSNCLKFSNFLRVDNRGFFTLFAFLLCFNNATTWLSDVITEHAKSPKNDFHKVPIKRPTTLLKMKLLLFQKRREGYINDAWSLYWFCFNSLLCWTFYSSPKIKYSTQILGSSIFHSFVRFCFFGLVKANTCFVIHYFLGHLSKGHNYRSKIKTLFCCLPSSRYQIWNKLTPPMITSFFPLKQNKKRWSKIKADPSLSQRPLDLAVEVRIKPELFRQLYFI